MNVILGDSRVLNVKRSQHSWGLKEVEDIWGRPGAKFSNCIDLVDDHIIYHHPPIANGTSHYYIAAGICDTTTKLSGPGYQEVIFNDSDELLTRIKDSIRNLDMHVLKQKAIPVFCTIYTMNIKAWNLHRLKQRKTKFLMHKDEYELMQENLNKAIDIINDLLVKTNIKNQVATPLTHMAITKNRRGKRYTLYNELVDGCHPGDEAISKIVGSINTAVAQNKSLH